MTYGLQDSVPYWRYMYPQARTRGNDHVEKGSSYWLVSWVFGGDLRSIFFSILSVILSGLCAGVFWI